MQGVMSFMLVLDALVVAVIVFIIWWFWLYKPKAVRSGNNAAAVEVLVADGTYTPARIEHTQGQPLLLRFLRRDPSPCAEKVLFTDLDISADLPLEQPVDVLIPAQTPAGEYGFSCQMQMYRGTLIVK